MTMTLTGVGDVPSNEAAAPIATRAGVHGDRSSIRSFAEYDVSQLG